VSLLYFLENGQYANNKTKKHFDYSSKASVKTLAKNEFERQFRNSEIKLFENGESPIHTEKIKELDDLDLAISSVINASTPTLVSELS
jgi:hypothetical protein